MYLYKNVLLPNSFNDIFYLTVTNTHIINITLEVRIPSVCPTAGQM